MVIYRGLFGFVGAILIGFIVGKLEKKDILKENAVEHSCSCGHDHSGEHHDHAHHDHCCEHHDHSHSHHNDVDGAEPKKNKIIKIIRDVIHHTNEEIKSVGAYLIFGAIIAASMQMFVPKEFIESIGEGLFSSTFVMMSLAFVLSLCSEADAFIASTFLLRFTAASVLTFLITGPMIDIKNTLMLFGSFKKRFVVKLIATILIVCFVLGIIASFLMGEAYA
jgi:uncharacterized membrane protein YraQ (UPF0718 family)